MIEPYKVELLADLLVNAEKELQAMFAKSPELEDVDKEIVRRDTYLATIRLWLDSNK